MLEVAISINGRTIARCAARNIADIDGLSDYEVRASSDPSPITGAGEMNHRIIVVGHHRAQSAWALVAKVAAEIAERENFWTTSRDGAENEGGQRG